MTVKTNIYTSSSLRYGNASLSSNALYKNIMGSGSNVWSNKKYYNPSTSISTSVPGEGLMSKLAPLAALLAAALPVLNAAGALKKTNSPAKDNNINTANDKNINDLNAAINDYDKHGNSDGLKKAIDDNTVTMEENTVSINAAEEGLEGTLTTNKETATDNLNTAKGSLLTDKEELGTLEANETRIENGIKNLDKNATGDKSIRDDLIKERDTNKKNIQKKNIEIQKDIDKIKTANKAIEDAKMAYDTKQKEIKNLKAANEKLQAAIDKANKALPDCYKGNNNNDNNNQTVNKTAVDINTNIDINGNSLDKKFKLSTGNITTPSLTDSFTKLLGGSQSTIATPPQ